MQIFYSNIKAGGEQAVTPNERREMRNAMVDYGALQPSPVVDDQPQVEGNDAMGDATMSDAAQSADEQQQQQVVSEMPTHAKTMESEVGAGVSFIAPADTDLFDTYFELSSAMHTSFADATQSFWEGFPGGMDIMDKPSG